MEGRRPPMRIRTRGRSGTGVRSLYPPVPPVVSAHEAVLVDGPCQESTENPLSRPGFVSEGHVRELGMRGRMNPE